MSWRDPVWLALLILLAILAVWSGCDWSRAPLGVPGVTVRGGEDWLEQTSPYPEPTDTVDLFTVFLKEEAFANARSLLAPNVELIVQAGRSDIRCSEVLLRKKGTDRCRLIGWIVNGEFSGRIPLDI
jgi:hypothetical protein